MQSTFLHSRHRGMTLVELLAAIAIVGVLSTITFAVTKNVRQAAAATEETSAARQVITGYLLTPLDYQGGYMPGYKEIQDKEFTDNSGRPLGKSSEDAKRFPWRLAPYLEKNINALFVGEHRDYLEANDDSYSISMRTSLGMNTIFVGGRYDGRASDPSYEPGRRGGSKAYPRDMWVLRPGDAYKPSQLIVFVSTHSLPEGYSGEAGYFRAKPPLSPGNSGWGTYREDIPDSMGNVQLRHNGKAVVANLDGSVTLLNETELRDMRRWSNQAAKFDDPNFSDWYSE